MLCFRSVLLLSFMMLVVMLEARPERVIHIFFILGLGMSRFYIVSSVSMWKEESAGDAIQTMYLCSCVHRVQWCFIPTRSSPSIHNFWHYRDVISQYILTMTDTRSN